MIPTTIFEIIDKSDIPEILVESPVQPLFLTAISSEKGPEDLRVVKGKDFYKLYGTEVSFAKHGQPLLQAAQIVNNGGSLLVKRVVAEDSTLANIAVVAKVSKQSVQKKDANGALLYTDGQGKETIVAAGNTPVMVDTCVIKYEAKSVAGAKDVNTIGLMVEADFNEDGPTFVYPLFTLADVGRGVSAKRFRITPDYANSKDLDYMKYTLDVIEKSEIVETLDFAFNPDIVEGTENKSIQNMVARYSNQVKCKMNEAYIEAFMAKVAELSGQPVDYLKENDVLFAKERRMAAISNVSIDDAGFNLSYIYGIDFENGTNGVFGVAPFGSDAYEAQLVAFFDGSYTDDIYDVDNYKIDAIVDANYPVNVKRAIENFVTFREDCFYFRDLGTDLRTKDAILVADSTSLKNKFCASYHNSYDIIDPYTKKQITVTIGYSLAKLIINHFIGGRARPMAGQLYGMTIPEAIQGTVNFIPKVTPSENQKQVLNDARINYASYFDGILTIETLYTSQVKYTQLSFLNNILAIQEVMKAVRTKCPKLRYSFIDGQDLEKYKRDVQTVLDKYTSNFKSLKLTYVEDPAMIANKVFYAALEVQFRDFVQTEYFKLFALS